MQAAFDYFDNFTTQDGKITSEEFEKTYNKIYGLKVNSNFGEFDIDKSDSYDIEEFTKNMMKVINYLNSQYYKV